MPTASPNQTSEASAQNETSGTLLSSEPLPLPEPLCGHRLAGCLAVAAPLIERARQRLRQGARAVAASYSHVPFNPETIEETLAENIAEPLLMMMARTMVLELNVARLEGALAGDDPSERFESFLTRLRQPEVASQLFAEYPVLREQLINHLDKWASANLEFLEHLCADWNDLRKAFFTRDPGPLAGLKGGAGDTHRCGRSVMVASFASGEQLVYKPRSLAVDAHFQQLLAWLNDCGAVPAFRLLKTLDRGGYGWSEFISASSCDTREEVDRFYRRQGGYLAVLYALEASDFHCENLIAAGEHPMLIDLEALFHPRIEDPTTAGADDIAGCTLRHSVLKVGMLPVRSWTGEGEPGVDISGLGTAAGQLTPRPMPCWVQAGTDEMRVARKRLAMPAAENRPLLKGHDIGPLDYAASIVAGFVSIYRLLMRHRVELPGILRWFVDDEVRVVIRATQTYGTLFYESFHPDVLRDKIDRVALFDRLADVSDCVFQKQLIFAERDDLLRGDIPIFTTRPGSCDIWTSTNEPIRDFFEHSGLASVEHRIGQLSESDLERQSWIIRVSIAALASQSADHPIRASLGLRSSQAEASREALLAAARSIADRLTELSLRIDDEAAWIGLVSSGQHGWRLLPLGQDLYDGLTGIILFLAYAGKVFADERYTCLARSALKNLWRHTRPTKDPRPLVTIGAFSGWGGIIYCLAHLGVIWGETSFFSDAEQLRDLIPDLLERDRYFDIISGAAGAILSLHALYRCRPSARTLEMIRACGDHLIQSSITTGQGIGWHCDSTAPSPLTGFAHGNAGIAYALLKAAALTGTGSFRDAAFQAFDYERSMFSAQHRNWPDLRADSGSHFVNAWCHGAPGIGLSRVCSLRHADDPQFMTEIEVALTTTIDQGFGGNHTLCHGDLGNADILLHAAETLGRPDWRVYANQVAAHTIQQAAESGWIFGNSQRVESLGLMTGLAGMGYAFLRLADPARTPSLLALEPPLLP
jgi:type 2 lantibiotic biosynthesis protein LanM